MSDMKNECKMILRLLTAIVAVPVLGAGFLLFGCDGLLVPLEVNTDLVDGDGGTDGDSDTDADSDADTDTDTGEPSQCMSGGNFGVDVIAYGECLAENSYCEGGYFWENEQGTCSDGYWCCIGTDQCEAQPVTEQCIETVCVPYTGQYTCTDSGNGYFGIRNLGCPDDQVCCFDSSECDWK